MKGQMAAVAVVVALLIGVAIGYLGNTTTRTTTQVVTETYTTTFQGMGTEECIVTEYHVWSVEMLDNGATIGGTSTQSYPVATFQTTGFPTTVTSYPTGTITGQIAYWNSTSCSQP